ncbi:metalloprotease PmbA [Coxiella endosymbiont of Amblyomma sculptum]|uniref:metalloprotease PmbA n=1 Tax=Coxiella endosymbiont of Amblyomma sculptum TaxID=2487929 RepID=UPI00132E9CA8|nr:metalloprotease PmbA [Coxiella endosymbiont of Amblyomma sculptum]QHG92381.1 metalloprotease PmbA [Coxiella endosymbiont of Amblyomma sculptum]
MAVYFCKKTQKKLQSDLLLLLDYARKRVDQVEISVNINRGFSVGVRLGRVETIEHHQENSLNITVYHQQHVGSASISDLSLTKMKFAFDKACVISQFTQADRCTGLEDSREMAMNYPNLRLAHPWLSSPEEAINLAVKCETAARKYDFRIKNSDGVVVNTYNSFRIYTNSHEFLGYYPSTIHSISCSLVAEQYGQMQRDYDYTIARNPDKLLPINVLAQRVAEKTIHRLGAKKIRTRCCPIIFHAPIAKGLLKLFVSSIQGRNIYRKTSFLCDHLNRKIFPEFSSVYQEPHLLEEFGSMPFDRIGVKTKKMNFVQNGVLMHYVLDTYSARKLGMKTTGNSGGVFNLFITTGNKSLGDLFAEMQTGLFVTELMNQGVDNLLTGNYSRGAFGYWIENGMIQHPVEEIVISGNLREMFENIQAVANDVDHRGNIKTGSILIEQMTIAGK